MTGEVRCRFKFPKALYNKAAMVLDPNGNWTMEPQCNEERLNAFNPLMTLGWRANIDFKPITTLHSVLKYITKYVSKPEYKTDAYIHIVQSVFSEVTPGSLARNDVACVLNKLIAERDYSAQEVMHHLLDLPLFKSSRDVVSINISPLREQRVQLNVEGPTRVVHFARTTMEYYMERETAASDLSFAQILCDFMRAKNKDVDSRWPYSRRSRGKSKVLKIFPRYSSNPQSPQYMDFCRAKMWLHHPFQIVEEMLIWQPGATNLMTWIEAYERCKSEHHHQVPDSLDEFPDIDEGDESDSEDISIEEYEDLVTQVRHDICSRRKY